MGQLESFSDYRPSMWLSNGVLFNQVASSIRRSAKATRTAAAAAFTALTVSASVSMPANTAIAWPPSMEEQRGLQALQAFNALCAQIDQKIARFATSGSEGIDPDLLEEAKLTVLAVSKKAG